MGGGEDTCPGGGYCHILYHISLVLPDIFITKIRSVPLLFTIYTIFLLGGYLEGHDICFVLCFGVCLCCSCTNSHLIGLRNQFATEPRHISGSLPPPPLPPPPPHTHTVACLHSRSTIKLSVRANPVGKMVRVLGCL